MYDFVGQLLAAIFGTITSKQKITSKTKYFVSITVGVAFLIAYSIVIFFDSKVEDKKRSILVFVELTGYLIVYLFILCLLIEYIQNYYIRKQKNKKDKDK